MKKLFSIEEIGKEKKSTIQLKRDEKLVMRELTDWEQKTICGGRQEASLNLFPCEFFFTGSTCSFLRAAFLDPFE